MIVVLDVNIIISALIKDSITREILAKSELDFYFPEPSMQKIRKYKSYIQEKTGLNELDFFKLFHSLLSFIKIIPTEDLMKHWENAKEIMEHIDPEDVTIIATALSQEEAIIWSDDNHFEKQNSVKTLKTKEMIELLE
ncbi:MAG: PIN domain-containing protein [Candidatus Woesearchaeota archaeon]